MSSRKKTRRRPPEPRAYVRPASGPRWPDRAPQFPDPLSAEGQALSMAVLELQLKEDPYMGMTADMAAIAARLDAGEVITPLELVWLTWSNIGPPEELMDRRPEVELDQMEHRLDELFELDRPLTAEERAWVDQLMVTCGYEPWDQIAWET